MKTTSIMLCMALAIGLSIGALLSYHQQQASAQMGMMNPNMMNRTGMMGSLMNPNTINNMMMNPGMMGMGNMMNMMFTGQNITSSVKLLPAMMNGISSQVKISLGDAVMTAQKELGNSSHAVAAHIGDERGSLIYRIWGIDSDMNIHQIIIDPGNGKVLFSQKLPMMQIMGMIGMGNMMNPMMGSMMGMNPNMMGHFWH